MNILTHFVSPSGKDCFSLLLMCVGFVLIGCANTPPQEEPADRPLIQTPPSSQAAENLRLLTETAVPARDLVDLTQRYKTGGIPIERTIQRPVETVGDVVSFWVSDDDADASVQRPMVLVYQSEQLNMWVEEGVDVDEVALAEAASVLEGEIFPTSRTFFGDEWRPGVDGDPRINIVHAQTLGSSVAGYFSASNSYPAVVNRFSNERESFFISLENADIGGDAYYEVITHEFQHMIHWNQDGNESSWLNEGLSELAVTLNEYEQSYHIPNFLISTDNPLSYFRQNSVDYGAAALFATYFYDRFGDEPTKQLVRTSENSVGSVQTVLRATAPEISFDVLFADWVVANYVNSHGYSAPPYTYNSIIFPDEIVPYEAAVGHEALTAVHQYGTDYIRFEGDEPLTISFQGSQQTRFIDTEPHSGDYFWTTLPGDASNMHLTRAFDLSAVETPTATLTFWSWYDIELGWDYVYIAVSTDGGASWEQLETINTSAANPHGNNLGVGLTGTSGSSDPPEWRQQTADLSPYISAGEILLRFEYVTDDAIYEQGFAVDDITIPELDYVDDVEAGDGGWTAVGFVRHTNELPQTFITQLILFDEDGTFTVTALPLDDQQRGRWSIPLNSQSSEAILTVSGSVFITTLPATYHYTVTAE